MGLSKRQYQRTNHPNDISDNNDWGYWGTTYTAPEKTDLDIRKWCIETVLKNVGNSDFTQVIRDAKKLEKYLNK